MELSCCFFVVVVVFVAAVVALSKFLGIIVTIVRTIFVSICLLVVAS